MKAMCPTDNKMTTSYYETKKLLAGLKLSHHKIRACPSGCMLFQKDADELENYSVCGAKRYIYETKIGKRIAKKVLIYFTIGPRLQRLYVTKNIAEYMALYREHPRSKGLMEHPSNVEAWKHFDNTFYELALEPCNVRLGLCTDGFPPFWSLWTKLFMLARHSHTLQSTSVDVQEETIYVHQSPHTRISGTWYEETDEHKLFLHAHPRRQIVRCENDGPT